MSLQTPTAKELEARGFTLVVCEKCGAPLVHWSANLRVKGTGVTRWEGTACSNPACPSYWRQPSMENEQADDPGQILIYCCPCCFKSTVALKE